MKFYKRFPGDITIKTGDLTLVEFGAYDRLLDHYYAKEQPIDPARVYTVARCQSAADRRAVDLVLAQYWTLTDAGWIQARADEVIAEALPRIEAAKTNGKMGGRPKKQVTDQKPTGFNSGTQGESQTGDLAKGSHKPDSSLRSEEDSPDGESVDGPPSDRPALALVPSKPGIPDCPHQALIALYAKHLPHLRQPMRWDGGRVESMRTRWRECAGPSLFGDGYSTQADGIAFWTRFFEFVATCPKLRDGITSREGGQMRVWKPDLPWLMKAENFAKVIEGAYAS